MEVLVEVKEETKDKLREIIKVKKHGLLAVKAIAFIAALLGCLIEFGLWVFAGWLLSMLTGLTAGTVAMVLLALYLGREVTHWSKRIFDDILTQLEE